MSKKYLDKYEYKTLRELVETSAEKHPNDNAFIVKYIHQDGVTYEEITYKRFIEEIHQFGTALVKQGFKGKRIAVIGKNSYEWALTYFTIQCGVGIIVPLDKGLPIDEIEYSLVKSKADAVVFDIEYLEQMRKIKDKKTTHLKNYICMKTIDPDSELSKYTENFHIETIADYISLGESELRKGNTSFINSEIDPNKMSLILFTSGTTSLAKAVMLTQTNILNSCNGVSRIVDVTPKDTTLAILPFHHTFGALSLMYFIAGGSCNVFCDGLRHIQENLVEYNVTAFICVPLLLEAMHKKIINTISKTGKTKKVEFAVKLSKFFLKFKIDIRRILFKDIIEKLGGLRMAISGASALDKKVEEDFNDWGIFTAQGYGLTETAPVLTGPTLDEHRIGSAGTAIPHVEVKINNPDEKGIGEIIAKGPNVMIGYYENEDATNEVIKDGWFYTGDLGYLDEDGWLFITGRKKNVIVLKNGKNVFPEELEECVNKIDYVLESMVFGYPKIVEEHSVLHENDDLIVSAKIVYDKKFFYPSSSEEQIKEKIWEDIKILNQTFPKYKHIKNLIISSEPMIKTTTAKIKRNEEMKKILQNDQKAINMDLNNS